MEGVLAFVFSLCPFLSFPGSMEPRGTGLLTCALYPSLPCMRAIFVGGGGGGGGVCASSVRWRFLGSVSVRPRMAWSQVGGRWGQVAEERCVGGMGMARLHGLACRGVCPALPWQCFNVVFAMLNTGAGWTVCLVDGGDRPRDSPVPASPMLLGAAHPTKQPSQ